MTALALTGDERLAMTSVAALLSCRMLGPALELLHGRARRVGQDIAAAIEAGADSRAVARTARAMLAAPATGRGA